MKIKLRFVLIAALIIGVGAYVGYGLYTGNWTLGLTAFQTTTTPTEEAPTEISFLVMDRARGVALDSVDDYDNPDAAIHVYKCDISELTAEQITELEFADYSIDESGKAEAVSIEPDADYVYLFNISVTGFSSWCGRYDSGSIESTQDLPLVTLGDNTVYLINLTADCGMLAYETETLGSTVANTNERDWTLMWQMDTEDEGVYGPQYDLDNDRFSYFCIIVEFNQTASSSWARTAASEVDPAETISSVNETIMFFSGFHYDSGEYLLRFGSGIGVDFELVDLSIGYGSPQDIAGITVWDTQA